MDSAKFEITRKITFQTGIFLVEIPMVFITIIFLASLDHNEERHVTTRRKGERKQAFARFIFARRRRQ